MAEQFQKELPFVHVIEKGKNEEYTRTVDFAITLGGDGTMLHLASLFKKAAPPVISFSLGTLCFLISYSEYNLRAFDGLDLIKECIDFEHYQQVLNDMIDGKVGLMMRMRLFCSLHQANGKRIEKDGQEVG